MSGIYELIGRLVVGLVRWRYQRELRVAAFVGVAATVIGLGAFLASRGGDQEAS
jgi:hypothetical protein